MKKNMITATAVFLLAAVIFKITYDVTGIPAFYSMMVTFGTVFYHFGMRLGVSNKTVSKWETGKCMPDYSVIEPLCSELGITVAEAGEVNGVGVYPCTGVVIFKNTLCFMVAFRIINESMAVEGHVISFSIVR